MKNSLRSTTDITKRFMESTYFNFLTLFSLCLTGCNSAQLSTPQVRAMDPAIERARHERHDPFPLSDLGPETHTRGREYGTPRTYPRRAQENYSKAIDPNRNPNVPAGPVGTRLYPDIVQE